MAEFENSINEKSSWIQGIKINLEAKYLYQ
jgi:hypothetical protein